MRSVSNSAVICWDDELGIQYRICKLDYTEWENGDFEYVFTPNYEVMDILPMNVVGGIPGIDLDLRLERYVRKNREPVFMTERSPSRNRVNLWDLLRSVGLDHYDRLEWLIRTNLTYSGDRLYVVRYEDPGQYVLKDGLKRDAIPLCMDLLAAIGRGCDVTVRNERLSPAEIVTTGSMLRFILLADKMKNPDREGIPKVGRKRKELDKATLTYAKLKIDKGECNASDAAKELGISKTTLYRRLRESGLMG